MCVLCVYAVCVASRCVSEYECAHMSHAKWDLLIWRLEDGGAGAGQWAPGGGAGKKKGWRSRAWFMRVH